MNGIREDIHRNGKKKQFPVLIILMILWAIARAAYGVLAILGQFRLASQFMGPTVKISYVEIWVNIFSNFERVTVIAFFAQSIIFILIASGILLRKNWARTGFVIGSLLVFLWHIRILIEGGISIIPVLSLFHLVAAIIFVRLDNVKRYFALCHPCNQKR